MRNTRPPQGFVTWDAFNRLREDLTFLAMRQQDPLPSFLGFREIAKVSKLPQAYIYNEAVRRKYYDPHAKRPGKKAGLWYDRAMELLRAIQSDTDWRETVLRAERQRQMERRGEADPEN